MKRILVITYYWPPAGGPGVQRWLSFVKYLGQFDIQVVVYTPSNATYPVTDDSLEAEIPENTEVIRLPISEPYKFASLLSGKRTRTLSSGIVTSKKPSFIERLLLYIRGNYFIPDARKNWIKPSVRYLTNYLSENKIDIIVTTGPPHSLHLIGLELKKTIGIKWFADFRDPWTSIHYHKSLRLTRSSQRKHKQLEQTVLQTADRIVVTSPRTKKEFEEITAVPISIITNGFDQLGPITPSNPDTKFTLVHTGSLLTERNPEVLWKVLGELCNRNSEFKHSLQIKLVGITSDEVVNGIKKAGLSENLILTGYIGHDRIIEVQRSAQVLLLVEIDKPETMAIIPGKLFEYMAARRPIIALGPEESDVRDLMRQTGTGEYFGYDQYDEIERHILSLYRKYKDGNLMVQSKDISQFSREQLTARLAELIRSI